MLEIKNIKKIYETADLKQTALNNVSINFRKCEFASVLGPSGSGKTTLLNIIGGLDQYNSGDLIINGVSTKNYKSRDWDSYRNHRVGFIFQSYNLIQHQSILTNVELALTLSGVSKFERVKRAKQALKSVGLERHMNKRPSQLSGGQMQRVAIARALINDPDILLADEPTGALDTQTSKQIMDLLKKVAKDKLVIMVTHNPELANEYSTRIIKLQDGSIIDDTNPFDGNDDEESSEITKQKSKKTNMSFLTAISLSFNNLLTKKGRTILTSFAGSIGIIGIALILSLSNGFQNYIDKIQEDTLTSYPLTIQSESMDFGTLMLSMMESSKVDGVKKGKVKETQQFVSMFSNVTSNDLTSLKKYLEEHDKELKSDVKAIKYNYSIDPNIYTTYKGKVTQVNPNSIFTSMFGGSSVMSSFSSQSSMFIECTDQELKGFEEDYKIVEGRWPKEYNEMVLVLPNENAISDLMLYMMGLRDMEELYDIMSKVMTGEKVDIKNEPLEYSYKDFLNLEYKLINKYDLYKHNSKYDIYEDMKDDEDYLKKVYKNAEAIKVVGVLAPKKDGSTSGMSGGFLYSDKLTKHVIKNASKSSIVKKQLKNTEIDVFTNKRFDAPKKNNNIKFEDFISVDTKMLQSAFNMNINEEDIKNMTAGYMGEINNAITTDITPARDLLLTSMNELLTGLIKYSDSKGMSSVENAADLTIEYLNSSEATNILSELQNKYLVPSDVYKTAFSGILAPLFMKTMGMTVSANDMISGMFDSTKPTYAKEADTVVNSLAQGMTEAKVKSDVLTKVGELTKELMQSISKSFNVDPAKIAKAFKFNMTENEMARLMSTMTTKNDGNASSNLINLGYQDLDEPTSISFTFYSFEGKQNFVDFIKKYNKKVKNDKDKQISYTDTTGILMSSVKKIVDSVSYVLIAFVSIALVVSSIMIGIITYISVLERTKEIGILRAIGASKHNISSIFNAETFIIGLLSGVLGIVVTILLNIPINNIIHKLTDNYNINSALPLGAGTILIILSIILTLIGGLIPSRIASKKDPVEALRSE